MDYEQAKERIERAAKTAAKDDETIEVALGPGSVGPMRCEVTFTQKGGRREWLGWEGVATPDDLLRNVLPLIEARRRIKSHSDA